MGEEEAGCFAFLWYVACVRSVMVCFHFLLVSLVPKVSKEHSSANVWWIVTLK